MRHDDHCLDAFIVEADYVNAQGRAPADFPAPAAVCDLSPRHAAARAMGMPLRTAQFRFARHAGHTIFAEIEERRFLAAYALLRQPDIKIGTLHTKCGYSCAHALRNVFPKRTGLSPSAWRKSHV